MIAYKDFFFIEGGGPESFIRGFLSEVCPLNEGETNKWRVCEECKNILNNFCSTSEYGLAVKCLADKLGV